VNIRCKGLAKNVFASHGQPAERQTPVELAPRWHTAALVTLIVAVALTGLTVGRGVAVWSPVAAGSRTREVYLPTLIVQWALVLYVSRVGRERNVLKQLLGLAPDTVPRACVDMAIATSGFFIVHAVEAFWQHEPAAAHAARLAVLPETAAERLVWIAVAVSVGFAEEIVYRGYLLAQLSAFTGSHAAGVVLQSVLFGLAHADQGIGAAVRVALYGAALGLIARVRRSLWPGILCHVAIDIWSGLSRN
jgi:membrane protease YdiL (CAAX protease family)